MLLSCFLISVIIAVVKTILFIVLGISAARLSGERQIGL